MNIGRVIESDRVGLRVRERGSIDSQLHNEPTQLHPSEALAQRFETKPFSCLLACLLARSSFPRALAKRGARAKRITLIRF